MADPILPIIDDIIARGVIKLMRLRPTAEPFVISGKGRYFDIFSGWRAQLTLLRRRLADEAVARRLSLAKGKALTELSASEFFAELASDPQTAIGSIRLFRSSTTGPAGVIKSGTKLRLDANPTASPPVKQANYVTTEPSYVQANAQFSNTIPIRATSPGVAGNIPKSVGVTPPSLVVDDVLYDQTLSVSSSEAAGGSSGVTTDDIRRFAKAMYAGQFAPTDGALIAGALSSAGVKHVALVDDYALGRKILFIADESWAWSGAFQNQCKQVLKDTWLGFGARMDVRQITNRNVTLSATIVLADPKFIDDTSELRSIVRDRVRQYFDTRPDFYTFNLNAIGGVIAVADPRILTCTDVAVKDLTSGATVTPAAISASRTFITRYFLADNGVTLTTTFPS